MITTEEVELQKGNITHVQDNYKYLGIPQANGNHEEAARKSATAKYLRRVRQVLRSQLNNPNTIRAINTYALPDIRYPAGIITWPKEKIEATNNKTRKLLTMHGRFCPKSNPRGGCALSEKREAEDWLASEQLSEMKKPSSSNTSGRWR